MKAIIAETPGPPEVLKLQDVPKPKAKDNEVLIKVEAISVNFADIKARIGQYHGVAANQPFTPGLDCAGVIEEVGSAVVGLSVGERVSAFPSSGSYAEYVVASDQLVYKIPETVSFEEAAASLTVGITAFNVLHKVARVQPGESLLIHAAAGGIGTTAIQLAKLAGVSKIYGTVGSGEKMELVTQLGARPINYREENFVDVLSEWTGGKGVDVILDTIAGENFERSLEVLAPFGRIVSFGHANEGSVPGNVKTDELHSSCRAVLGYSTGTYRKHRPEFLREAHEAISDLLEQQQLTVAITGRYPLAEAAQAHVLMESRKSTGKLVLIP
ncbi:zinc-binding dehydrogenase [Planococcus sp. ISL-109]|uniref:quinone oxidoreductase family protein n=1 Tax=Planococcus sp. ISL-109 TaxID=2819166 RepID=UPI001BE5402A|nr:zinc-binding dehydrogenase [Planococcus sp. ISL-109]MBT2582656.1 zinc-binding dehydrogenase [Planococcus sp. ISL-109]